MDIFVERLCVKHFTILKHYIKAAIINRDSQATNGVALTFYYQVQVVPNLSTLPVSRKYNFYLFEYSGVF